MILVDTNVLLDLVGRDPVWTTWSRNELRAAGITDQLVINDIIYAELAAGYPRAEDVDAFLARSGISMRRMPRLALFIAGKAFRRYRAVGGTGTGVLPDFFIGAHAAVTNSALITRDPRRYRTYFSALELITPDIH